MHHSASPGDEFSILKVSLDNRKYCLWPQTKMSSVSILKKWECHPLMTKISAPCRILLDRLEQESTQQPLHSTGASTPGLSWCSDRYAATANQLLAHKQEESDGEQILWCVQVTALWMPANVCLCITAGNIEKVCPNSVIHEHCCNSPS